MLVGDATNFTFADLVLANGSKVYYQRTSPGTDEASAVMGHTGTAPWARRCARRTRGPAARDR